MKRYRSRPPRFPNTLLAIKTGATEQISGIPPPIMTINNLLMIIDRFARLPPPYQLLLVETTFFFTFKRNGQKKRMIWRKNSAFFVFQGRW